ncbi:glycosyltransferase [Isoptericola variabilis]|uniref:UDP-glucuronosyl/UDP-glucosyltransferase n=1 Tax=Isoptericola variabilis (strain 225) TaxID=743718 RepID=F6FPF6_ISOV2|nr:glycosyltransferase [Isoptericola variabilis]AEG43669.1 UDP-glucuronosyl/UDP-glucosyltransferase [Isoptericola variabilis 225]
MRVLFATTAGLGHFRPQVPLARAVRDAGHEVRVAAPASFARHVTDAGLEHAPFDDADPEALGRVFGSLPGLAPEEANHRVVTQVFGRLDPQAALPRLAALVETWRPDVIVREPGEVASLAAAEAAGVLHVVSGIGLGRLHAWMIEGLAEPLQDLAARAGIPDRDLAAAARDEQVFTTLPASFDEPGPALPHDPVRYRAEPDGATAPPLPAWGDPDAPLVYVTFGSVAAGQPTFEPMYPLVLDALADLDARVLLTTGTHGDPDALRPWPANARVERWWPQEALMPAGGEPAATAMVGHGGFGTTTTALATGVPQVVVPLFASDQWLNARRVADVGAGLAVEAGPELVERLPGAVRSVLDDGTYRAPARRLADEMAALPPAAATVERVLTAGSTARTRPS